MPTSPIVFQGLSSEPFQQALSQLGAAGGGALAQRQNAKRNVQEGTLLNTALQELAQNPNAGTQDVLARFAQLQQQGVRPESLQQYMQPAVKGSLARQKEQAGKEEKIEDVRNAFNRVNEIQKTGATGFSAGALTEKGRALRAELDNLSEIFIGALIPILNPRGAISQSRFDYIKSLVPNSSDTDAKIKGKMEGLSQIFKLNEEAKPAEAPKTSERSQNEAPSSGKMIKLKHKGSGDVAEVPEERFLGIPENEQSLYERI